MLILTVSVTLSLGIPGLTVMVAVPTVPLVAGITALGATASQLLLVVAGMCLVSSWIAQRLHRACD
jgi:hypothetical protein